jgi:hypothetical protein
MLQAIRNTDAYPPLSMGKGKPQIRKHGWTLWLVAAGRGWHLAQSNDAMS